MRAAALLTILNVLTFASSYPTPVKNDQKTCIDLTPERKSSIEFIEEEISKLLLKLESRTGDLIVTDLTLNIVKYSEGDSVKDINVDINYNPCDQNNTDDEVVFYIDDDKTNEDTGKSNANDTNNEVVEIDKSQEANAETNIEQNNANKTADVTNSDGIIEAETVINNQVAKDEIETINTNENVITENVNSYASDNVTDETEIGTNASDVDNETNITTNSSSVVENESSDFSTSSSGNFDEVTDDIDTNCEDRNDDDGKKNTPELMLYRLNNKEHKIVSEMEKKRGIKPFILIQKSNGEREIKFFPV